MGITSNDIAAQRAMLERGEEKRKAAKQAEERDRLRDTFAAAALPLCTRNGRNAEQISESAYKLAAAMLVERSRTGQAAGDTLPQSRTGKNVAEAVPEVEKCTERDNDHDAVPEARADADRGRTDKAVTRPGDGTGNTPSPESYDKSDDKWVNTSTHRGIDRAAYEGDIASRLRNWRGLHLAHGGKLFDEAADEIGRLREAVRRLAEQDATLSVQGGNVTVTHDATLTDAEREAIRVAILEMDTLHSGEFAKADTLRKLLERLT